MYALTVHDHIGYTANVVEDVDLPPAVRAAFDTDPDLVEVSVRTASGDQFAAARVAAPSTRRAWVPAPRVDEGTCGFDPGI